MGISVREARPEDSRAVARMHRECIPWGLISQLGEDVVAAVYLAVARSPAAFCFVAEQEGRLDGFAAGVTDWPKLQRRVLRTALWPLVKAAPTLSRSGRWRRVLETKRYASSGYEDVQAEFFSIGVRESAPGRLFVAAALLKAVMNEFRQRNVTRFRGVVGDHNERALKFFETMGFEFVADIDIHAGERSRVFVVDLSQGSSERNSGETPRNDA